jgi:hypothetical protein
MAADRPQDFEISGACLPGGREPLIGLGLLPVNEYHSGRPMAQFRMAIISAGASAIQFAQYPPTR